MKGQIKQIFNIYLNLSMFQFAVKEIELDKCDQSGRDQAHGEANLLSRLKHVNILSYVESVICDDRLYIVTEFCEGGDLEDYLQLLAKKSLTVPEALISQWILQLGEALKVRLETLTEQQLTKAKESHILQ